MASFSIDESAIRLADEITLGDLLRITDQEQNRKGIVRIISYSKGHLSKKIGKTDEDRNLLLDLIELMNSIGEEKFDEAFSKERARQQRRDQGATLPVVRDLRRVDVSARKARRGS